MGDLAKLLTGGGQGDAKAEADRARKERAVANDRQLQAANEQDKKASGSRRAPRGRRLFEDGALGLATKLGE